jgi:hypothetical protein
VRALRQGLVHLAAKAQGEANQRRLRKEPAALLRLVLLLVLLVLLRTGGLGR